LESCCGTPITRVMVKLLARPVRFASFIRDYVDTEIRRVSGNQVRRPATPRQALEQWLDKMGDDLPPVRGRVLITALRNYTWIEWAAYCACVVRLMGFESTLIYDSQLVAKLYSSPTSRGFFSQLRRIPGIELVDLNDRGASSDAAERWSDLAEEWAPVALAYELHLEEYDVRRESTRYAGELQSYKDRASRLATRLDAYLRGRSFHRAFCFSGLIGESKLLLDVLRANEVETICVEGWAWRPGHMIYNRNAPALEYNVDGWLRALGTWSADKEREIDAYLQFLDTDHREGEWLENFYRVQKDLVSASLPAHVKEFLEGPDAVFLLAPNVIGDSSMLKRETIFAGQQAWVEEIIRWFAQRPHLKLVVRAHPAERWIGPKCRIYMGEVARKAAAGLNNVLVIDSSDRLNTFSLVPFLRAGLAWLSSAGVDMVVRGVPVAVAANPKYSGLGIVEEPASRDEYFALLERWAANMERPSREQVTQGKRYLHMVFKGFSFEAGGRDYRAMGCRLGAMPSQEEHDQFYRILIGDAPMPDQPAA
jgi:hypothetical protein